MRCGRGGERRWGRGGEMRGDWVEEGILGR